MLTGGARQILWEERLVRVFGVRSEDGGDGGSGVAEGERGKRGEGKGRKGEQENRIEKKDGQKWRANEVEKEKE